MTKQIRQHSLCGSLFSQLVWSNIVLECIFISLKLSGSIKRLKKAKPVSFMFEEKYKASLNDTKYGEELKTLLERFWRWNNS